MFGSLQEFADYITEITNKKISVDDVMIDMGLRYLKSIGNRDEIPLEIINKIYTPFYQELMKICKNLDIVHNEEFYFELIYRLFVVNLERLKNISYDDISSLIFEIISQMTNNQIDYNRYLTISYAINQCRFNLQYKYIPTFFEIIEKKNSYQTPIDFIESVYGLSLISDSYSDIRNMCLDLYDGDKNKLCCQIRKVIVENKDNKYYYPKINLPMKEILDIFFDGYKNIIVSLNYCNFECIPEELLLSILAKEWELSFKLIGDRDEKYGNDEDKLVFIVLYQDKYYLAITPEKIKQGPRVNI